MLRLTLFGDVHYCTGEPEDSSIVRHRSSRILETALGQVRRRSPPPDLLIQIGDMIDGSGQSPAQARADLQQATDMFDRTGLPWTWIPGNHDVVFCGGKAQLLPYLRRPCTFDEIVLGDNVLLLLDSAIEEIYGRIGPEQQAWIEQRLEAHRDRRIFVFCHHVFDWSVEHDMFIENADAVRALLLEAHAVKAVFVGHVHAHQIATIDGMHEIATSALTSWPLLFRHVEILPDRMRVTSERVAVDPEIDAEAVAAHRAHPKPWRSEPYDRDLDVDLPFR